MTGHTYGKILIRIHNFLRWKSAKEAKFSNLYFILVIIVNSFHYIVGKITEIIIFTFED